MSAAPIFEWAAAELERLTQLDQLQARGTIRLVVKEAGLTVDALTLRRWRVVATKLLPRALTAGGVADPQAVSAALCEVPAAVEQAAENAFDKSPDAILRRLVGKHPPASSR